MAINKGDTLNSLLEASPMWKADWEPEFRLDLEQTTPAEYAQTVQDFEAWAKTQPQDKLPLVSGWYTVQPQQAELMLIRNAGNRKPALSTVKRYARRMKANDWPRTGQALVVNDRGRSMDHQHRNWASYFGNVSYDTYIVADGVSDDPKLFSYYDGGKSRTLTEVLRTAGLNGHANVMGKAVMVGNDYDTEAFVISGKGLKRLPVPSLTKVDVIDFIKEHPDLETVAEAVNSEVYKAGITLVKHKEVAAFVAFRQLQLYGEEKMDEFWSGLAEPSTAPQPIQQLHNLLERNREASEKAKKSPQFKPRYSLMTTLAYLIRATNAFVNGEPTFAESFKLKDRFPRFEEAPEELEAEAA